MTSTLTRSGVAVVAGVALVAGLAVSAWSGGAAKAARDMPDWVAQDAAPGWMLVETRREGRVLVVAPGREISTCVDVVGWAQEAADGVSLSVRGDLTRCHYPLDLAAWIPRTVVRLEEPLAGREVLGGDRVALKGGLLLRTYVSRRVEPPGLVGLRVGLVRETLKAWDLKLKVLGPTSERAYVVSQRSKRKVRRGDVMTVRTTKKRPR